MLLEKREEEKIEHIQARQTVMPRGKVAVWLFAATLVLGLLALWASVFAVKDLNSVKERLEAGLAEGERPEICAELKRLGYLIADCEKMPEEDLRELVKNIGKINHTDAETLAKIFKVKNKREFHQKIKKQIVDDFKGLKGWSPKNPTWLLPKTQNTLSL